MTRLTTFIAFVSLCLLQTINTAPQPAALSSDTLKYMSSLGYYNPDNNAGTLETEKNIRNALMDMQRFAGIPATGQVDEATKKLIETPRCGMKDVTGRLSGVKKRKRRYTLQGSKWRKEDLTWKLVNDNNDGLTRQEVEDVMEQAFDKWHKITNLNFKKLVHTDPTEPDIVVMFGIGYHNDPYQFDGRGGTLAHAFYPHNNQGLSGDVHFDDDEVYTIGSSQGKSLLWVAVHEIGHSIGLEHSNLQEAVMYPWYRGNGGKDFDLNEDDIVGAQHIYGSRSPDPEEPSKTTTTTLAPGKTTPSSPPSICIDQFKAALLHKDTGKTYIINNGFVYVLGKQLGIESGPTPVREIFSRMSNVDSLYYNTKGEIVIHDGKNYYMYDDIKGRQIETGTIQEKYGLNDDVSKIDAAFIWIGNGRVYLFVDKMYYRFDEGRSSIDNGYPKVIKGNWKGLPESVDGVSIWRNKVTYFFKDKLYYRFNDEKIRVENNYPKPINPIWTKCTVGKLENTHNASVTSQASILITIGMLAIIKFLFL